MTTTPDIATLPAADLIGLKAAIDDRLEEIRRRHVEEGAELGLTLVQDAATPKRKRRTNTHKEAD